MRIVLAHGFPGFVRLPVIGLEYFRGVRQLLESKFPNVQVKVTRVDPLGTIEQRAREFRRQVEEFATERVHIIGHSAGGLDARFLVSPNGSGMARLVASITTIATPHRGTPVADWFAQPDQEVANVIARFSRFVNGLRHLTTKAMEEFNKEHPPVGSIPSFSYAGNMQGRRSAFSLLHDIISRREGANDGLVTVASARWEDYKGVEPADHAQLVGHDLSLIGAVGNLFGLRRYDHFDLFRRITEHRRSLA